MARGPPTRCPAQSECSPTEVVIPGDPTLIIATPAPPSGVVSENSDLVGNPEKFGPAGNL